MTVLVILAGIFGGVVGWHWKLMHRSWRDVRTTMAQLRDRQALRTHHTTVAILYAFVAILVLVLIVKAR